MPLSSLFYPDFFPLADSENRIKLAKISETDTSFFDLLTKLLNSNQTFLLGKASDHNYPIQASLKEIWENNEKPFSREHINSQYNHIINRKSKSHYVDELISIIVTARYQELKVKKDFPNEETQLQFFKETQKRINFMIKIAHIFANTLYVPEITVSFHCFLIAIFSDILSITVNISEGLFNEAFPHHYKEIMGCFEQIATIGEDFSQATRLLLSSDETNASFLSKLTISEALAQTSLAYAKYYFALGEDQRAFSYLKPFTIQNQSAENNAEQNFFMARIKELEPDKEALMAAIELNTKRNFYVKVLIGLKKIGSLELENDLEPKIKEIYQTAIVNNTLANALTDFLFKILAYYNSPEKSLDMIPQSLIFIGLIAQKDYYNNSEISQGCKLIFENAEKIITGIIDNDYTNIIAKYIKEHLCSYASKMNFFKPSSNPTQDDILPSYLMACSEEKQKPLASSVLPPHSTSFFSLVCGLIFSVDNLSITVTKASITSALEKIWFNNSCTIKEKKQIIPIVQLCNLKTLLSIIVCARNQVIETAKRLPPITEEEQLQHFEDTQQRFNFMICIANIIGKKLYALNLQTERYQFLMGICIDTMTNARDTSRGLFLEHFQIYPTEMSLYCQDALTAGGQSILGALLKKCSTHDTTFIFDMQVYTIHWPLYYAKYYSAIGDNKTALEYLNKSTKPIESQSKEQSRLLKSLVAELSKQKEMLSTAIAADYQRTIYIRILTYFNETDIIIQGTLKTTIQDIAQKLKQHTEISPNSLADIEHALLALRVMREENYNNDPNKFLLSNQILSYLLTLFDSQKHPENLIFIKIESYLYMHKDKMCLKTAPTVIENLKIKNVQLRKKHAKILDEQLKAAEVTSKEVQQLQENFSNITQEIQKNQEKNKASLAKTQQLEKQSEALQQEEHTVDLDLKNTDDTLVSLQATIAELQKQYCLLSRAAKKLKKVQQKKLEKVSLDLVTIKKLESEVTHLKEQEKSNTQALMAIERQLETTNASIKMSQASPDDFIKKMDANIRDLNAELATLQEKMVKLNSDNIKFNTIAQNAHTMHIATTQRIESLNTANRAFFATQSQDIQGFLNILSKLTQHASANQITIPFLRQQIEAVKPDDELKDYRRYKTS